jgi:hypothetical protein
MWAKFRAAVLYVRERWMFLLVIVVLLLMLQFLVSVAWITKNGMPVRMANFFESSRLNDLFRIESVSTQKWIRETSPFWISKVSIIWHIFGL